MDAAVGYAVAKERGIAAVYSTNPAYDKTDLRRDF
jgi:predicted nucleic acid-binding protein